MRRTKAAASSEAEINSSCPAASPSPTSTAILARRSSREACVSQSLRLVSTARAAVVLIGELLLLPSVPRQEGSGKLLHQCTDPQSECDPEKEVPTGTQASACYNSS